MVLSMERWVGKVAIVTGASAGIGAAIAKRLAENGMIVAGLARRVERVEQLASGMKGTKGQLYAVKCDITKEEDILEAFKWVSEKLGPVHVLVNNAGIFTPDSLMDGKTENWKKIIDTNVLGLCIGTREAIKIMKSHKIDGHIFHINSTVGHMIPPAQYPTNMYAATKYSVTALAEILRLEINREDLRIKITSISPGGTATEITAAADLPADMIETVLGLNKLLDPEDIADALIYALSTPPHVQVKELTVKPLKEPF